MAEVRRPELDRKGFDQSDQQPGHHRSRQAREPADHAGAEGLEPVEPAHGGVEHVVVHPHQNAGHAAEHRAHGEGRHVDQVDVDPHGIGRLVVLGRGADDHARAWCG